MKTFIALLALLVVHLGWANEIPTSKKGVAGVIKGQSKRVEKKALRSLKVGWFYHWTGSTTFGKIKDAPFVPMIWGTKDWAMKSLSGQRVSKSKTATSPLLGFNEPDGKKQANMSVEQAIKLWPLLEKTRRRLGSPATVHANNDWMKQFMKQADQKGLRVDFVCVHWYGNDANQFIRHLKEIHQLYQRPIWITEFALADWQAKKPEDNRHKPEDVIAFMKKVLPQLDELEFIERYAWFSSSPEGTALGTSALFHPDGTLTEVGQFYANHESPAPPR